MKLQTKEKRGFSLVVAFGAYGGWYSHVFDDTYMKRVCLGWISITLIMRDFDFFLADLLPEDKDAQPSPTN